VWRVACACGFEQKAPSAWEATAIARRHAQLLIDSPESGHEIIVEEPSDAPAPRPSLDDDRKELASQRIRAKLWDGVLPNAAPIATRAGHGPGRPCDGCDLPIGAREAEQAVELEDGRGLRFHVACASLWQVLRMALPASENKEGS
jgi:hypothetical protein